MEQDPEGGTRAVVPHGQIGLARSGVVRPTNPFDPFDRNDLERSIPERFERQSHNDPDRVALRTASESVTYACLNARANRLARSIVVKRGNRAEPVIMLVRHSAAPVTGILAILKAGKFVVPVDPAWPDARIEQVLTETEAQLIVADAASAARAGSLARGPVRMVVLEEVNHATQDDNLDTPLGPDDVASILFTSSSSGAPKGVVQSHRNLMHCALRHTNGCHISARDRLSYLASPAYAASVPDLLGALLNGACLLPYSIRDEGLGGLAAWLERERVTVYHSVSSVFRALARQLDGTEAFADLRLIILGGESVTLHDVTLHRRHFPASCLLHVGLGTTETNVVRRFFVDHDVPVASAQIPVGYPVEDFEVSVVDSTGNAAAPGEIGEIMITSRYLALEYWRRPDLTASAFRQDPTNPSQRSYKSGDVGRMKSDGCLEHCGRKDSQVKIRGQRIELAEIESALLGLGLFDDAVVVARPGEHGEPRLVAYVVATAAGAALENEDLSRRLAAQLPLAMVPSAFVVVAELPMTATGKVDRRELAGSPVFAPALPAPKRAPAPAQSSLEAKLAALWSKVLGCGPVASNDSFFALGGDSLSAMELCALIETMIDRKLPWTALLQAPTPARLASLLLDPAIDFSRLTLRPFSDGDPEFVFIFALGAMAPRLSKGRVQSRPTAASRREGAEDVPSRPDRPDPRAELAKSLAPEVGLYSFDYGDDLRVETVARELVREARRIQPSGPYHLGGSSFGGLIVYEAARILVEEGEDVAVLAIIDTSGPGFPRVVTSRTERFRLRWRRLKALPLYQWPGHLSNVCRSYITRKAAAMTSRLEDDDEPAAIDHFDEFRRQASAYLRTVPRFPGRITLLRARIKYDSPRLSFEDPTNGWGAVADGGIRTILIPGNHFTMLEPQHVPAVGQALRTCLLDDEAGRLWEQGSSACESGQARG
jgi:amino acid adenylation domain-containing protein